jgi:hypothetical protein
VVERLEVKKIVRWEMEGWSVEQKNCVELNSGVGEQHYGEISVTSRALPLSK